MDPIQFIDTEVSIIGSGIAGLKAVFEAMKMGAQSLLVSKYPIGIATNTIFAGGLFTFATPPFNVNAHYEKTLEVGQFGCAIGGNSSCKIQEFLGMGLKGYHCKQVFTE